MWDNLKRFKWEFKFNSIITEVKDSENDEIITQDIHISNECNRYDVEINIKIPSTMSKYNNENKYF